jgi:hypothetical protein
MQLPNPWTTPTLSIPDAGMLLGLSRTRAYEAVRAGDLPTLIMGTRRCVLTVSVYDALNLPVPARPIVPVVRS